ncbi:transposase family protein [Streptomyces avermitilis]|uniref:transposase family protein n=1 Tax=Streptomyces avermitilis TaxID=33903 RepID=UPI0033AB7A10
MRRAVRQVVSSAESASGRRDGAGFHASRTHKLTPGQKTANRVIAAGRAPVEHGFARLKNWRTLTKLRTDPARATHLLRALLVLTNLEVDR